MKKLLFNEKETKHQGPCYGKEMAWILLPIRAWEAKKILLSDKVYIRARDFPPFLSQQNTIRQTTPLCWQEQNTGGTMKLTISISCEK
jgi:hypothetical protein